MSRVPLISYFASGDALRSRGVGVATPTATLALPAPPARLLADWTREIDTRLQLEPGDVEQMPLARAIVRWPDYGACVRAMRDWTAALGLGDALDAGDIALMACRGARYHHDGNQYGGAAFCNLFLSEDKGLDLVFAQTGRRIALTRGTAVLFDTCQPHGVVPRGASVFDAADFADGRDLSQVFLTWELPIEDARVAGALGIDFDVDAAGAARLDAEQVRRGDARQCVRPDSGQWTDAD
ncbi:MAG: hypothetical protein LKI62_10480 [Achromobacter ruhlandii]|jgi:hypothetical protein|uniref:hypothetical protein n=1 Tax=Achromobacter ruhlandii TaxID=72557 RepID=UPI001EEE5336|nr:hypothetical protein [Achromobacter ruhlandii]MCI1837097.1 hypothetical protein [Achromobacter ruhlandii]MCZ8396327.1 hypothetical protein [Achromobacter ruhlandii]